MKCASQKTEAVAVAAISILMLFVFAVAPQKAKTASPESGLWNGRTVTSKPITSDFVIADFTGDTHPDLATIELDRIETSKANYWIDVRLTEGTRQLLTLTAPVGGVQIVPEDVTGDGNLDLVIRSAKTHNPVAVFLNDGNGHFSAAGPSQFVNVLSRPDAPNEVARLLFHADPSPGCTVFLSLEPDKNASCHILRPSKKRVAIDGIIARAPFSRLGANRAPPSQI